MWGNDDKPNNSFPASVIKIWYKKFYLIVGNSLCVHCVLDKRRSSQCIALCCVIQLLDCYLEAYHHVFDRDERRSLAQVITNIMYRRPRFDFSADYFVRCYQLECYCLRLQTELVESILGTQVNNVNDHIVSWNHWCLMCCDSFTFLSTAGKNFTQVLVFTARQHSLLCRALY